MQQREQIELAKKKLCYYSRKVKFPKPLNEYVPDSHVWDVVQEILDHVEFEGLHLPEVNAKSVFISGYVIRDFPYFKSGKDKRYKAIQEAYQTVRQRENEIRNTMKLVEIRLEKEWNEWLRTKYPKGRYYGKGKTKEIHAKA